jgi:hypothetical protein
VDGKQSYTHLATNAPMQMNKRSRNSDEHKPPKEMTMKPAKTKKLSKYWQTRKATTFRTTEELATIQNDKPTPAAMHTPTLEIPERIIGIVAAEYTKATVENPRDAIFYNIERALYACPQIVRAVNVHDKYDRIVKALAYWLEGGNLPEASALMPDGEDTFGEAIKESIK